VMYGMVVVCEVVDLLTDPTSYSTAKGRFRTEFSAYVPKKQ
jgi:hypothetical protein